MRNAWCYRSRVMVRMGEWQSILLWANDMNYEQLLDHFSKNISTIIYELLELKIKHAHCTSHIDISGNIRVYEHCIQLLAKQALTVKCHEFEKSFNIFRIYNAHILEFWLLWHPHKQLNIEHYANGWQIYNCFTFCSL